MSSLSLKVGIIGLPNVGKSTLFNALLKKRVALSANYPFATVEPNVGVVPVPDARLQELAELVAHSTSEEPKPTSEVSKLPPIVPAVVQFVDIAGLVKGAHQGAGLGNKFLSHIREVDAIVHVVRDFADENVVREGSENPDGDKLTIETELSLADLQVLEKIIPAQEKEARAARDPLEDKKLEILNIVRKNLEEGKILGHYEISTSSDFVGNNFNSSSEKLAFGLQPNVGDERLKDWFKSLPLLTTKPILYVLNVDEDGYKKKIEDRIENENELVICAKVEEELADYSEEERRQYLNSIGVEQTGLERLIKKAYELLGLISFLTAGKKEVRAWTILKGSKAPEAAGAIHTDFEKGFIRAQVIEYEKLIEAGSYKKAKEQGLIRTEGKDYEIKDGDVVEFLVNT